MTSDAERGNDRYVCPAGRHRRLSPFADSAGPCAQCAFEQVRDDVTDVLRGLLTDRAALVDQVVAKVATSGEKTRQLHAWLTADADPLGRGDTNTPAVAQALLRALQDGGVSVVLPLCVACGQHRRRLTKITEAGRVCMTCYQRQSAQPCARCGRTRIVTARDEQGRALCQRCRANDPVTWRTCGVCGKTAPLTAVQDGIVIGRCCYVPLSQRCTVCGLAKAVRRLSGRRSTCRGCREVPVVDCTSCGLDAPVPDPGRQALGEALCARCRGGNPLPCNECGTATVARTADGTPRCPDCYRRPVGVCGRCGRPRPIARLAAGEDPDLCAACWRGPVTECAGCGRRRPCRGERAGMMLCEACRTGNPQPCSLCGRIRRITAHWPDGPVCKACYCQTRALHGTCSRCGQQTRLLRHTRGAPACPACLGVPDQGRCVNCGTVEARLPTRGHCTRCSVAARLRELLPPDDINDHGSSGGQGSGDDAGTTAAGSGAVAALAGLRVVLAEAPSQRGVLDWLTRRSSAGRVLLERLARGEIECSHEGLDALEQTVALTRLRHLLVAAGCLPERDPVLAVTIRWVEQFLTELPDPQHAQVLRCLVRWKLLPRLRSAAERAPLRTPVGYAVRTTVRDVARFLAFLTSQGRTLGTCRQEDLDTWAADHPSTISVLSTFWAWAARRGDMPRLRRPTPPPAGVAIATVGRDERWALARTLLSEDGIATADRVAGCLVLIYGQRPGSVVQLTTADVLLPTEPDRPAEDRQPPVRIRLGVTPVEVPDPLAGHLRALLAEHRGPTTAAVTSPWLFPSPTAPGRPIGAVAVSRRLSRLGLAPEMHRSSALLDLSTQMPPAVLADLLGIAVSTAERWAALAGRDRVAYLNLPRA